MMPVARFVSLLVLLAAPAVAAEATPNDALTRLREICRTTRFCTPSFWAWELQLAVVRKDREQAETIAGILCKLQQPDGKWGLGTDWGRTKCDFKARTAQDAESWEVAEVANALLDYATAFGEKTAARHAKKAAEYLKKSIVYHDAKPYLPHMPECNRILQPHSTVNAALLLSRVEGFQQLAEKLKSSGVAMNFLRIITQCDREVLAVPDVGHEINDYEKIQIGYYLVQMGDPRGWEILGRYKTPDDINHPRGAAYVVLAYTKLGKSANARSFAARLKDYRARKGYEYALKDFVDYVNTPRAP